MISFKNKKVLVVGLGLHGGGVGTVKFLAKEGAKITITDLRFKEILQPSLKKIAGLKNINPALEKDIFSCKNMKTNNISKHRGAVLDEDASNHQVFFKGGVKYVLGKHRLADFLEADLIIKGPGVKPDSNFIIEAKKRDIPVLNDMAIFLDRCPAKIIGVTGSRGKSTTAFLIWKFLQEKYKVWLAGNIRKSVLELLPKIKTGDWVVLELSSFQLQDMADSDLDIKDKPEIAVVTNIYKEHLNWHKNFKDYLRAKIYITAFQNSKNYLFLNPADKNLKNFARNSKARIIFSELDGNIRKIVDQNLGSHYRSSVVLAVEVAKLLGVSKEFIEKGLRTFYGLPGRQEKIREIGDVKFINDTTSTMPESTIVCVERFWKLKNKGAKIILIAGGQDKNLDYDYLAKIIADKVGVLVLLPGTATDKLESRIKNLELRLNSKGNKILNSKFQILYSESMFEAVKKAYAAAKTGDYILLSPGAASFGLFLNEFNRGEKFIEAVKRLE